MPQRIVTLLTDFGPNDYYVGAMKGVILDSNPEAQVVDITHGLIPYDVLDAAFTLAQVYSYYPTGTVHVVVVDPGGGSERRPLIARGDNHYFLAPDNGVLSFIYPKQEMLVVYHMTAPHYFRQPVSNTFHGRDVFAAAAGWVSRGVEIEKFGEEITDYVKLAPPKAAKTGEKSWKGMALKIDRFGSVITNIAAEDCPALFADQTPGFKIKIGGKEISKLVKNYAEGQKGEVVALLGSSGYLEIAANKGAAAQALGARRGAEVLLELA